MADPDPPRSPGCALVLGGSFDQVPLVLALRERGFVVVLVDRTSAPPASEHAHVHCRQSWADVDGVVALGHRHRATHVFCAGIDAAQVVAAAAALELGIEFQISVRQARLTTDKARMKQRMADRGVPTAPYAVATEPADLEGMAQAGGPWVVKPADSSGSNGVRVVWRREDIKRGFADAVECSPTGSVIVEPYLRGPEITIDAFVSGGRAQVVLVSENVAQVRGHESMIVSTVYQPQLHHRLLPEARDLCQSIVAAFGLRNTPLLVQAKREDTGLVVLELSARLAGGFKSALVKRVTGIDLMTAYIDLVTGRGFNVRPQYRGEHVSMSYIAGRSGVFARIAGVEEALAGGLVEQVIACKQPGTHLEASFNARSRVAAFTSASATADGLAARVAAARSTLRVLSDEDTDLTWSPGPCLVADSKRVGE